MFFLWRPRCKIRAKKSISKVSFQYFFRAFPLNQQIVCHQDYLSFHLDLTIKSQNIKRRYQNSSRQKGKTNGAFWSSRTLNRKGQWGKKELSFKNNGTDRGLQVEESEKLQTHINDIEHGLPLERIILKCLLLMNWRFFMFTGVQ